MTFLHMYTSFDYKSHGYLDEPKIKTKFVPYFSYRLDRDRVIPMAEP